MTASGTFTCHTPCGTNEERTNAIDATCICIAGHEN
jgi:hypothetical protein